MAESRPACAPDGEMSAPATPTTLKRVRCSPIGAAPTGQHRDYEHTTPPSSILTSAGTTRARGSGGGGSVGDASSPSGSVLAGASPTLRRSLDASFASTGCFTGSGPIVSAFKAPWRKCAAISTLFGLLAYVCFLGEEGVMSSVSGNSSSRGGSGGSASERNKQLKTSARMAAKENKGQGREALMTTYDDDDITERSVDETSDSNDEEEDEEEEDELKITHEQLLAQLAKDIARDIRSKPDTAEDETTADATPTPKDSKYQISTASSESADEEDDRILDETTTTPGVSAGSRPYYVVYASDEQSRPGVVASIRSVQAHAAGPVEFLFVGDEPLTDLPETVRVHFRQLSKVAEQYDLREFENDRFVRHGKNTGLNTNPANYVRFVIHELLPKQSKAMWIDADTIVECDVVQLMKDALTDPNQPKHTIAAVPREGIITGLTRRGRKYSADVTVSFNAGIYILHLERWREQHMTEMIRRIAKVNRQYGLYLKGSQPPLALVVGENFEHLPESWNVKMASDLWTEQKEWICLMHWSGPNKPWNHGHEGKIHPEYWLTWGNPVDPEDVDE